jgi:muramoyltetrapeptide carboxypeptidase
MAVIHPTVVKPRRLRSGDLIRIVSPASPLSADKLEAATGLLEGEGYRVELARHALERDDYLAGSDAQRAADLQEAFDEPEVAAVYCSRGGYGCSRLMPHLDIDRIAASRKMFLGFSDVTTLHVALNRRGVATVHAPMALTLSSQRQPWVYESFLNVLKGGEPVPETAPRGQTMVGGRAVARVVGGCLCLLCDSIGTADSLDAVGKILLIEDVDENPHRIDAMLTHLLLSGVADGVAGFVIGEMTRSDEKVDEGIGGKPWKEIVRDRLGPLGKPTIVDFPFGHMRDMLTLPLGISAEMDADAGTLKYRESLCAD